MQAFPLFTTFIWRSFIRADAEAELEKRLEKLRTVKGATPYGQGSKADRKPVAASSTAAGASPSSAVLRFPRKAQVQPVSYGIMHASGF